MTDLSHTQTIAELRRTLLDDVQAPVGLTSRLVAGVATYRRGANGLTLGQRLVVSAVAFSLLVAASGSSGIVAAAIVTILYVPGAARGLAHDG